MAFKGSQVASMCSGTRTRGLTLSSLLEVPLLSPSSQEGEAVRFLLPFYSCIFVGGPWQVFRKQGKEMTQTWKLASILHTQPLPLFSAFYCHSCTELCGKAAC